MYAYRDLIRIYATGVAAGTNDPDLSPQERRLTQVLLNLASNAGAATVAYPPNDATRDEVVKSLNPILWDARPLVEAVSFRASGALSNAIERATQVLRSL